METTIVIGAAVFVATAAAIHDLRWRRIPNWLTGAALLSGVVVNVWLAASHSSGTGTVGLGGLAGTDNVWLAGLGGLGTALAGAALGLVLLLPFYALRGVGAGDVKLLAAIGALVGHETLLWVALFGALVGGVMSLGLLAQRGRLGPMLQQLSLGIRPAASGLKAPYGVAIAGGVYLAALFGAVA